MSASAFFDTNVLIYAFAGNDVRVEVAERLLNAGGVISVQILNETANTLRGKLKFTWPRVGQIIEVILENCPAPQPITLETHRSALRICERYGYSVYDGLVIAAALEAHCSILYSEDMQHGQTVESLRIVNPFRETEN